MQGKQALAVRWARRQAALIIVNSSSKTNLWPTIRAVHYPILQHVYGPIGCDLDNATGSRRRRSSIDRGQSSFRPTAHRPAQRRTATVYPTRCSGHRVEHPVIAADDHRERG